MACDEKFIYLIGSCFEVQTSDVGYFSGNLYIESFLCVEALDSNPIRAVFFRLWDIHLRFRRQCLPEQGSSNGEGHPLLFQCH
jgi:hypothetical protein